ncbi:hypothetical protein ACHHYP_08844 [Achlya hypogyna]|uniref:Uncharacterized protein n=1 Tax=Achlya hypogyna TaxID=1202772 RepID=A0A1V9YP69_ACHHY|nr:hypothetical protein ACHHYP_08844 [Achlya hypogyna]
MHPKRSMHKHLSALRDDPAFALSGSAEWRTKYLGKLAIGRPETAAASLERKKSAPIMIPKSRSSSCDSFTWDHPAQLTSPLDLATSDDTDDDCDDDDYLFDDVDVFGLELPPVTVRHDEVPAPAPRRTEAFIPPHQLVAARDCFSLGVHRQFRKKPTAGI